MKSLSLVIPVYGAGRMLGAILGHVPGLKEVAGKCGFELVETIVVDDGSAQPVAAVTDAGGVPVKVLRNPRNRGKGYSVRRGALAAAGKWVLMSDVDESVPLVSFEAFAPHCGAAIVCGSRRCGRDDRPMHRRILSCLFSALTGTGIKDTQCGFKLFNMALMRPVFETMRTERFAFDVELIRKAPSAIAVPVAWHGRRRSSLKVWRDAPRMLWDLALIRCMPPFSLANTERPRGHT